MSNTILIDYPHRVYPMKVERAGTTVTKDRIIPGYDPMPTADWSQMDGLRWLLGVASLENGLPLTLYRQRPSSGLFALVIGNRLPIRQLTADRALDVLAGVAEALACLGQVLDA